MNLRMALAAAAGIIAMSVGSARAQIPPIPACLDFTNLVSSTGATLRDVHWYGVLSNYSAGSTSRLTGSVFGHNNFGQAMYGGFTFPQPTLPPPGNTDAKVTASVVGTRASVEYRCNLTTRSATVLQDFIDPARADRSFTGSCAIRIGQAVCRGATPPPPPAQ